MFINVTKAKILVVLSSPFDETLTVASLLWSMICSVKNFDHAYIKYKFIPEEHISNIITGELVTPISNFPVVQDGYLLPD